MINTTWAIAGVTVVIVKPRNKASFIEHHFSTYYTSSMYNLHSLIWECSYIWHLVELTCDNISRAYSSCCIYRSKIRGVHKRILGPYKNIVPCKHFGQPPHVWQYNSVTNRQVRKWKQVRSEHTENNFWRVLNRHKWSRIQPDRGYSCWSDSSVTFSFIFIGTREKT